MVLALLAEGLAVECKLAGCGTGPSPAAGFNYRLEAVFAKRSFVVVQTKLVVAPDVEHTQCVPVRRQVVDGICINRQPVRINASDSLGIAAAKQRCRYIDGRCQRGKQRHVVQYVVTIIVGNLVPLLFGVIGVVDDDVAHMRFGSFSMCGMSNSSQASNKFGRFNPSPTT